MKKWELLSRKTKYANPWLKVVEKHYKLADGRKTQWYIVERPNAAGVFCLTKEGKVVVIRHYRPGVDKLIFDLPTGHIDKGETPLQAAKRELREETGFKAGKFISLGCSAANPSGNTTMLYWFLALEGTLSHDQDLDDGEEIQVKLLTIKQLLKKMDSGEFMDGTRLGVVYRALEKLGKLKIKL